MMVMTISKQGTRKRESPEIKADVSRGNGEGGRKGKKERENKETERGRR